MDTPEQKFASIIWHKMGTNLNLVEGEVGRDFPFFIVIPESTFEKNGFDKQDIQELLKTYRAFYNVFYEYKYFTYSPLRKESEMDIVEIAAYDFYSKIDSKEREGVYVIVINPDKFHKVYQKLFLDHLKRKITYNHITGVGALRRKNFKFKNHQPEYILFKILYENPNEPVRLKDVLKILNKDDDSLGRLAVNDLAKKIRTRTGLTTEELVLNNGDITLSI